MNAIRKSFDALINYIAPKPKISENEKKTAYETLFPKQPLKPLIKEINLPEGEETFFLDTDEIKRLIYGLKPRTAAGPSGISVELL